MIFRGLLSAVLPAWTAAATAALVPATQNPVGAESDTAKRDGALADRGGETYVAPGGGGGDAVAAAGETTGHVRVATPAAWETAGGESSTPIRPSQSVAGSSGAAVFPTSGMVAVAQAGPDQPAGRFRWAPESRNAADAPIRVSSRRGAGASPLVVNTTAASTSSTITVQPQPVSVIAGQPATLSVTATAAGALTYQWRRQGVVIPGATGASYVIGPARRQDEGHYDVLVTAADVQVTSERAHLTVAPTRYPGAMFIDPEFSPVIEAIGGTISAVAAQADGKLLIGGSFRSVNGAPWNGIARLNADGSIDAGFNPGTGTDAPVRAVVVQPDGRILIGGEFTRYNGVSRGRVARLNADGSLDVTFNTSVGANSAVLAIALAPGGTVQIGGAFEMVNGIGRIRLARLGGDGAVLASFNPGAGPNSEVNSLAFQSDGKLIVGGGFTTFAGATRHRIVRLHANGGVDSSFDRGPLGNSFVHAVAVQSDGKILIGGYSGTNPNTFFGRVHADGSNDASFTTGTGPNNEVDVIVVQPDGKILIGGWFSAYDGQPRSRVARLNSDGTLDSYSPASFDLLGNVRAAALLPGGQVAIGGSFYNFANAAVTGLRLFQSSGAQDRSFAVETRVPGFVNEMIQQPDGKLQLLGFFNYINNTARNYVARILATGAIDPGFDPGTGFERSIEVMALQPDGRIVVGGFFNSYNGTGRSKLVRIQPDGSLDSTFNPGSGPDFGVTALALQPDGKLILGGAFTSYAGTGRNHIARIHPDGTLDLSFHPGSGSDGWVFDLALQPDGRILAGGWFNSYDGTSRGGVVRVLSNGALDTTFDPGGGADFGLGTLLLEPDGKVVVGGSFYNFAGVSQWRLARTLADGTRDASFLPGDTSTYGSVGALFRQADGRILVGQEINSSGSGVTSGFLRVTSTGARDGSFSVPGLSDAKLTRIIMLDDGQLLVAGEMFNTGNRRQAGVARLAHLDTPVITAHPAPVLAALDGGASFSVRATGGALTYQWKRNGQPIEGATGATLTLSNLTMAAAGTYTVTVTNALGSRTSDPASLGIAGRALLLGSSRPHAGTGGAAVTGAFTIEGSAAKRMLIRAVGPTLASFGVSGVQADPQLEITHATTGAAIAGNNDWGGAANAADIPAASAQAGAFALASGSKDAVVLATLEPGTYRVRVSGGTGIVLLEVYEADQTPRLVYLAFRARIGLGSQSFSGGISINPAMAGRSYLLRALGPSLGVPEAVEDPVLTVREVSTNTVVATNDNWGGEGAVASAAGAVGAMPLAVGSKDAALVFTPTSAGSYSFVLTGAGNTEGIALLEVFEVDAHRAVSIPVAIVSQPEPTTAEAGLPARLGVVALGKPIPALQWRRGGVPLSGATGSQLHWPAVLPSDAGTYDVVATNPGGVAVSAAATLSVTPANRATHAVLGGGYHAGDTAAVRNTLHYIAPVTRLTWSVTLPAGWSFASDDSTASSRPAAGATGVLIWTWDNPPASPVVFASSFNVPPAETTTRTLSATAVVRPPSAAEVSLVVAPDPLGLGRVTTHSSDTDHDWAISLFELTRVIELYNTRHGTVRTGAYRRDPAGEDGFGADAPRPAGAMALLQRYHSADTRGAGPGAGRDGMIDLFELTRVIELYNTRAGTVRTGRYRVQAGTEDGFAAGP